MIKDRRIVLVFRIFSLLFAVTGVFKQIGVFDGEISGASFMYYTIQSNLLVIVLFAMLVFRTVKSLREDGETRGGACWFPRFAMVCSLDVMVTFVVFWLLLAPLMEPQYLKTFENIAVHGITPLLCLADYVLFTNCRHLKYRDIYYACIFPVFYVIFSAVAGLSGYAYGYRGFPESSWSSAIDFEPIRAPYFFLDYWTIGLAAVIYIAVILAFFILSGHLFYFIDRRRKSDIFNTDLGL